MSAPLRIRSASRTDKGNVRRLNEDAFLDLPARRLWAVADGMGGHSGGEIASRMTVDALRGVPCQPTPARFIDTVEDALAAVNERLCDISDKREPGSIIGCTLAMLIAFPAHCLVGWMGDSRVYRSRGSDFTQLTQDHSQVEALIANGTITRAQGHDHASANVITRAMGGARELFLDLDLFELEPGDRFLICSDGLYRELSDRELALHLNDGNVETACDSLVEHALRGECSDNVTAVVVDFQNGEPIPSRTTRIER